MTPPPDLGAPTTLVLVRHGSTGWTERALMCGGDDEGPALSDLGRAEAQRAATAVLAALPGLPPAGGPVVVSSPALRARQTAEAVATALGVPVSTDAGWAELRLGEWQGLDHAAIVRGWPQEYRAWRGSMDARPPGGESLTELVGRVSAARGRLVAAHPGRVVVVVTHLGCVRAAVREVLDAGPAALWRLDVSPGSLTVLRWWADGEGQLALANGGAPWCLDG